MTPTFATVAAVSFCVALPFGYLIGEDVGRAEGAESERIKWTERERNREKGLER